MANILEGLGSRKSCDYRQKKIYIFHTNLFVGSVTIVIFVVNYSKMKKQDENTKYASLRLPAALIDELKLWKQAASNAAMRPVSYAEFIRGLLDSLDDTEPDVTHEMDRMIESHPEIAKKIGRVAK